MFSLNNDTYFLRIARWRRRNPQVPASRPPHSGAVPQTVLVLLLTGASGCPGSPAANEASARRTPLRLELEQLEEQPDPSDFRVWLEIDRGRAPHSSFLLKFMAETPEAPISRVESFSLASPTLPPLNGNATVRDPYDFGITKFGVHQHFFFDEESGGYKSEGNALRPATHPPFTIPPGTHTVQLSYIVKDEEVQAVEEHMGWEAARHVVGPTYRLHVPPPT